MRSKKKVWSAGWGLGTLLLILLLCAAALCLGRFSAAPGEVAAVLLPWLFEGAQVSDTVRNVVLNIRLPRIAGAILCGGGLAAAGAGFQAVFANPLATPDTLGVATAASFGAVLAILLGLASAGIQGSAMAAGLFSVALVCLMGRSRNASPVLMLVLSGMVASSLFSALTSLVKYIADPQDKLPAITYWLLGSLKNMDWRTLSGGGFWILAGGLVLWLLRWKLDALSLSSEEAAALGLPTAVLRTAVIVSSAMITAAVVSMCGQIGWIGLLIPHMCRMVFGGSNRHVIPASMAAGAVFLLVTDTVARSATAAEIPVSLLTAVVGAPVFILLLRRTGGIRL